MADNTVLFVFEGSRTEPQILENLKKHYFDGENSTIIHATFDTHIYILWDEVKNDKYLDLLEVIRERNDKNRTDLEGISREDIDRIFLFFDYDGHVNEASDETIRKMLAHFNSPDENGKLYISYPMVEAVKHHQIGVDFKDITVPARNKIVCEEKQEKYKTLIGRLTIYPDLTSLKKNNWNHIILENYKKSNFIVNDRFEKPEYKEIDNLNQENIFIHQLEKYITSHEMVAVLSAFPFFIIEYFGEKEFSLL